MNTNCIAAAAVPGARHLRAGRNGQDAAAAWAGDGCGAVVVCDGCGSGGSSEVGARLGAQLAIAVLAERLAAGDAPAAIWPVLRARVTAALAPLVDAMPGGREAVVHEHFLFTLLAAARQGDTVGIWALGDGAYALGDRVTMLGPFAGNQPPYLGYDLLGAPQPAHVHTASAACGRAAVATDGVAPDDLVAIAAAPLGHPDALRRKLALLARPGERIDWDARRIERRPALLQDDGAVALLQWSAA